MAKSKSQKRREASLKAEKKSPRITSETVNKAPKRIEDENSQVSSTPEVAKQAEPKKPDVLKQAKQAGIDVSELVSALKEQVMEAMKAEQTANPSATPGVSSISETDIQRHETKKEAMKAHLAKQPKVRYRIPLAPKEKRGEAFETVILNGYRLNIPKGVSVDLPQQVVDILDAHFEQTEAALDNNLRLDKASNDTLEALEG